MAESRRLVTIDLDGVLCRPPFDFNPGSGKGKRRDAPGRAGVLWATERWRYRGRRPMPGAVDGLRALQASFDIAVLSARGEAARTLTERWFQRHFGFCPVLNIRPHWRETSAQFKARRIVELGAFAHVEDDPHTAEWLAEIVEAVCLVDWPRNRWLEGDRIHRVSGIGQAAEVLARLASQPE